jgi:Ca2+-binding EF-hand superfamily protein
MQWLNQSKMKTGHHKSILSQFDENQDGSLDSTELSAFALDLSEKSGKTVDAGSLLTILDTNQDGVISEEELQAGRSQVMTQYGPPKPEDIYKKLDANQDGSLDETEISAFASQLSGKTGKTVDGKTLLTALDSDGNGIVSESEFKSGRKKVEEMFGLPDPREMKDTDTTSTYSASNNSTTNTLSNYIMDLLGSNTNENSTESTTTYQSLSNLLLSSYTTNNTALYGTSSLLNLSA